VILVFGSINLDLIYSLPHIPKAGETVLTSDLLVQPGGKGANQAVAAARDGAQVTMVGAVGRDVLADEALGLLKGAGVDLAHVRRVEATTGCATISLDSDGNNAIAVASGANLSVRADQVADEFLTHSTTLVLQMEVPAGETAFLIRRANGRVGRIILNLAPASELDQDALALVDFLIVNETEGAWLANKLACDNTAASFHAALSVGIIRTLGGDGLEAATKFGAWRFPARQIIPVDTTAAGDCFVGVLAASLDRGMSLNSALRRATAAAGLCCTRHGSQASLPFRTEIDAFG
jgi:ribokinase